MKNNIYKYLLVFVLLINGCDGLLGVKDPNIAIDFPPLPQTDVKSIEFIQLLPVWNGFNQPEDVIVGFDDLVYVADTKNNKVIQLDVNGKILGSINIPEPTAIIQDRRLDLLVIGKYDSTFGNIKIKLSCLYRIKLVKYNHQISNSIATPVIIHPGYILGRNLKVSDSSVTFTGVAVMSDNQYYISRRGKDNLSLIQSGGPDNNILWFDKNDKLITPLTGYLNPIGSGKASSNGITNIATYAVPPQRSNVDTKKHFLLTLDGETSFRVQGMRYSSGREDVAFLPDPQLENIDTTIGRRFLYDSDPTDDLLQSGFKSPEKILYTADRGYIVVVDSGTDSLYLFTSSGIEGILPPTYSGERKNIIVSFGGTGSGNKQFNKPMGVAYFQSDRIFYVADKGNNRITRFKLSTDFK